MEIEEVAGGPDQQSGVDDLDRKLGRGCGEFEAAVQFESRDDLDGGSEAHLDDRQGDGGVEMERGSDTGERKIAQCRAGAHRQTEVCSYTGSGGGNGAVGLETEEIAGRPDDEIGVGDRDRPTTCGASENQSTTKDKARAPECGLDQNTEERNRGV